MPVAKTYKGYNIISNVYVLNGRTYVKIKHPINGYEKQVRWYTDSEYQKMYGKPESEVKSVKDTLGFKNGFITIFKGNTYPYKDMLKSAGAKYKPLWGWYFSSELELPSNIPEDIEAIQLLWEDVCGGGDMIKPEHQIKEIVEALIYDASPSEYVGEVGERIEVSAKLIKINQISSYYGISYLHTFEDDFGNIFVWFSSSKCWEVGEWYDFRGKVKSHSTFRNVKQTVLTNCKVVD